MRLFRKLKRKLLPKYSSRFQELNHRRFHRKLLYKTKAFIHEYFYNSTINERHFREIKRTTDADVKESVGEFLYLLSINDFAGKNKINKFITQPDDIFSLKWEFLINSGLCYYVGVGINTFRNKNLLPYCFNVNFVQFCSFWKDYSQAPFWKKYKIWLKKQEIDKDF